MDLNEHYGMIKVLLFIAQSKENMDKDHVYKISDLKISFLIRLFMIYKTICKYVVWNISFWVKTSKQEK